ncbi:MAG: Hsp20/alpha crystallin family protein [Acidobacteria bacterium]|nr:Hsp20/alpha crystallin family protein [Acidobacteriota bacterium]
MGFGDMSRKKQPHEIGELFSLQRHVQGLFHREARAGHGTGVCWTPVTDVYEMEDRFVIILEVPGIVRKDMEIVAQGNEIVIKGIRRPAPEFGKANFHQLEREFGEFHRVFTFETVLDPNRVEASLRNGVLVVTVPKASAGGADAVPVH